MASRAFARTLLALCIVLLIWAYATFITLSKEELAFKTSTFPSRASGTYGFPTSQDARRFWETFATAVAKGEPSFAEIEMQQKQGSYVAYDPDDEKPRPDVLTISDEQLEEMRRLHSGIVHDTQKLASRLPFVPGTRGIVTSAGNDGLTVLTASLRMLRIAGCTLPVEVLMNTLEHKSCDVILPKLGARCIRLSDHMSEAARASLPFEKYGFKSAAIAFSSFEQVLFLDNDVFPVMDPLEIFTSEPFLSSGMVLWPDYWASTTSPLYYRISNTTAPDLRDRPSTESGAILIDKSTHAESILLAIYYNIYTWGLYYRLFAQGAMGEGDKETWASAAVVFNQSVYHVNEAPNRIGYECDGHDRPVGSGQHHPTDDWYLSQHGIDRKRKPFIDAGPPSRVLFIHGNLPKYDAASILEWWLPSADWTDLLRCNGGKGRAHRLWGSKELTVAKYGWDVEKHVWDSMRWVACEHGGDFDMWANGTWHSEPKVGLCERIVAFWEELLVGERFEGEVAVWARQPTWERVHGGMG